ncbi:MAG: right-handed parallel beta-helix repeat-containing protein [Candidatus Methanospirare jalkutatii]|nr:right-handed parallel beta-helix repeat-containing protein [Candidatus Methanospirare jalkutatii]
MNGKPLVYLEDESDKFIDNAGQIILVRCKNITIMNAELTNTDVGIELFESDNCLISNIISSNNDDGIFLLNSNNNSISENKISSNNDDGICLGYSNNNSISNNKIRLNYYGIGLSYSNNNSISENIISLNDNGIVIWFSNNNIIYMNNFINNTCNAFSNGSNIWNSTETITYTYKGKTFTNYLGNYWDDYTGSDANGDGIGDTPYSIDEDKDNYPLIERFENYFMPTPAKIFDTGRPENPYPSISGEFVGTIKTNKKIIAKKLYTYACEGTGGHTEYALICNSTWCAEAKWEGYKGDWMNISFNKTVILMPYETYNITIVTGSYPQIHHTPSLKTENGWINCTEFIDANGKKYENWIPAIKLWS